MLKTITVEIDEDEVVAASLTDTLEYVEDYLWRHRSPDGAPSVFSNDPLEDIKKLKKFRGALKKVLSWYTV